MTSQVVALHPGKTIAEAADAFLHRDMAATTRRSYAQTINRLTAEHGAAAGRDARRRDPGRLHRGGVGQCAPATWNRHVATLRSFTAFARRRGWLTADPAGVLERRTEPADRTKAIAAVLAGTAVSPRGRRDPREVPLAAAVRDSRPRARSPQRRRRRTSTWRTSACACGARAATATGCTSNPAQHACCPG